MECGIPSPALNISELAIKLYSYTCRSQSSRNNRGHKRMTSSMNQELAYVPTRDCPLSNASKQELAFA